MWLTKDKSVLPREYWNSTSYGNRTLGIPGSQEMVVWWPEIWQIFHGETMFSTLRIWMKRYEHMNPSQIDVDDFRVSLFCWRNHFERNLHFFVYCTYCIIIQFLWELLEWESSHQLRQRKDIIRALLTRVPVLVPAPDNFERYWFL